MENSGSPAISVDVSATRKKRSKNSRRPHPNPKPVLNISCSPSNSFHELDSYGGYRDINDIYRSDYSRVGPGSGSSAEDFPAETYGNSSTDLAVESVRFCNESKVKKVKLKVGGVTHTIQSKSPTEIGHDNKASTESSAQVGFAQDFHGKGAASAKLLSVKLKTNGVADGEQYYNTLPARKSKRIPKKRTLDEGFTDEEDEELRYLGKLRASKSASVYKDKHGKGSWQTQRNLDVQVLSQDSECPGLHHNKNYGSSVFDKAGEKKLTFHEDIDYVAEEDPTSDNELEDTKKKNKKVHLDSLVGGGNELTITTRKRALENCRVASPGSGSGVILPIGLPTVPAKRQKEVLSEVDQQLRKAEASQRRRLQAEKAAKEAEAEAIRKILGQDSTRKRKEEKLKRQQEELAQEKISRAAALEPNTVRWVMGPSGTVVTFSDDIGFPKMFTSLSCSYPPPREKCVGPNCNNEYKYRDSKSKLPLCSLHCYKAVQEKMELLPAR